MLQSFGEALYKCLTTIKIIIIAFLPITEATLSPVKKIRGPQSESLIEREIRRQQEKEQEFRREKGLVSSSAAEALTNTETEGVTDAGEQVEIAKDQETAKKEVWSQDFYTCLNVNSSLNSSPQSSHTEVCGLKPNIIYLYPEADLKHILNHCGTCC